MNIGARIREIRLSKGVTQKHILGKLNKHNSWLSKIESGGSEINAEDLKHVADILCVPIEEFFLPCNLTFSKKYTA